MAGSIFAVLVDACLACVWCTLWGLRAGFQQARVDMLLKQQPRPKDLTSTGRSGPDSGCSKTQQRKWWPTSDSLQPITAPDRAYWMPACPARSSISSPAELGSSSHTSAEAERPWQLSGLSTILHSNRRC